MALHADDDGLGPIRERIRRYGLRSEQEKLMAVLRELKQAEVQHVKDFAEYEDKGADPEGTAHPRACVHAPAACWHARLLAAFVHTSHKPSGAPASPAACQPGRRLADRQACRQTQAGLPARPSVALARCVSSRFWGACPALRWPTAGKEYLMRYYRKQWKEAAEKLELLHANPRKFVWRHGHEHGIDTFWWKPYILFILWCLVVLMLPLLSSL